MNKSIFVLGLASLGVVALVGCSNGGGGSTSSVPSATSETTSQTTSEPATTSVTSEASSEAWYEISERAMQSFLDKIQAGGYTIIGDKTNGLTTCVHDENMVTWFFKDESPYYDHVCVTVDGESYYAIIDDEKQELVEMQFLDKKPALEVSESQLPNHWVSKAVSGGNIWTLFHNNNQDNPLQFRGTPSTAFNDTIAAMCDFANLVGPTIQDITLEFDNEDVNKADLKFTYIPGGTQQRVDGSLSIVFGREVRQSDLVLAWVANPARPYPSPVGGHSDWPLEYKTAIGSTYEANMPRAADPMPYDNFFSYATNFNSRTLIYDGYVQVHDFHADEEDAKQYMNTLLENGYQAAIGASEPSSAARS